MRQRSGTVLAAAVLAIGAALLSGCYEDVTPALHSPGVYEGKQDPLRAKLKSGDLQAQLDQRFQRVTQDR